MSSSPSAVGYEDRTYVFHRAKYDGNRLFVNRLGYDENGWTGDIEFGDVEMSSSPSATVFKDRIWCFYNSSDQRLRVKSIPGLKRYVKPPPVPRNDSSDPFINA